MFNRMVPAAIDRGLIHPPYALPLVLYFHAALFSSRVVLFVAQSALIRTINVKVHRQLGLWTVAIGVAVPNIGVATGIAMASVEAAHGDTGAARFRAIPLLQASADPDRAIFAGAQESPSTC
jgi:hypothetical protein